MAIRGDDSHVRFAGAGLVDANGFFDGCKHIDLAILDSNMSAFDLRHVEHVVDQREKMPASHSGPLHVAVLSSRHGLTKCRACE